MKPLLKLLFIQLIHGSKEPKCDVNLRKKFSKNYLIFIQNIEENYFYRIRCSLLYQQFSKISSKTIFQVHAVHRS